MCSKVEYDNNSTEKYEIIKYTIQEFTISARVNSIIPILKKQNHFICLVLLTYHFSIDL